MSVNFSDALKKELSEEADDSLESQIAIAKPFLQKLLDETFNGKGEEFESALSDIAAQEPESLGAVEITDDIVYDPVEYCLRVSYEPVEWPENVLAAFFKGTALYGPAFYNAIQPTGKVVNASGEVIIDTLFSVYFEADDEDTNLYLLEVHADEA